MDMSSPPLVGRARERLAIGDVVARLAHGAVCVEVVGEPGIGKTTMLASLSEVAAADGALVLGGRGSEFEHDVAFGLFVDGLDEHLDTIDDRWSRNLDPGVAAELATIFPALSSTDAGPRPVRLPSERFRGHRAVRVLLERLAATRPLVLTLDDVHWADRASLELVGALLRRPPAARVLIALAYRPHQAPERLVRELATAAREGVLARVELGPLSQEEADALLARATSARDRVRLFTESGGNPFYLHQLARVGVRSRAVGDLGAGVPSAVVASLLGELESVSSRARQLARAAAVTGDPFDLDLAAEVGDLDRRAALVAVDELVEANLVRADIGPLTFAFRHPLVRRAMYESAQPGWRVGAHSRADAALARRGGPATVRAHHVERSATVGDPTAIELLKSAAAAAIVPGASADWLHAALRLVPADGEQRLGLLCGLSEALAAAGRLEESRATLVEALARWPVDTDVDGRVALVVLCAAVERLLGRHEQARARLSAAAGELEGGAVSAAGVSLAIELAVQRVFSDDFTTVSDQAFVAMRGAIALGDSLLHATALAIAGFGGYCAGDPQSARTRTAEASALVAGLDDATVSRRPDVFFFLGWSHYSLDRYVAAVEQFDRGLVVARATGRGQLYVELAVGHAHALGALGRLTEAQVGLEEAVDAARLSENPQPLAWALGFSCIGHLKSGDLDRAMHAGREGVALAVDRSTVSATCRIHLGMALVESGDEADGVEMILEFGGGPELTRIFPGSRPSLYEALTRAEIGLGRLERAADWARRAGRAVDGVSWDLPLAHADRAAAAVLLVRGDAVGAAARAAAAVATADRLHAPVEAARARMLAGRALAAAGQRERAGEQLRAAESQLAACGAGRLREECARELRRIGLRVARAGQRGDATRQGPAALSGREREVADLVRGRCTNREIAAQLFLSEKTVESHLRSVFVKLGVTSRADVARALDAAAP